MSKCDEIQVASKLQVLRLAHGFTPQNTICTLLYASKQNSNEEGVCNKDNTEISLMSTVGVNMILQYERKRKQSRDLFENACKALCAIKRRESI